MLIEHPDSRYEVIQKRKTTDVLDLYIVKDLNDEKQRLYTAVCVKDRELSRKLILVTTKKNTNISFRDLHESFNLEGNYYIVFRYTKGETLQQALQEHTFSLQERLLLLKNIFGQLFLLNMPDCFIYEALRKDSIVVNQALEVSFNYFFTEVDYYWQIEEKHCLRRVGELVQELFHKELAEKQDKELTEFSKNLTQERFSNLWDCYDACNDLYEHLTAKSEREEIRPGRFWWRAWEAFKRKIPVIKAVLSVLLIVAAGAFLLFHLPNPVLSEDGIAFEKIGTLEIPQGKR